MEEARPNLEREVEKPQPFNPLCIPPPSNTYHLSSPFIAPYRIRSHAVISSAAPSPFSPPSSSSSSSSSTRIATAIPAASEFTSLDYKKPFVQYQGLPPPPSSPLLIKDLLSQLASSMSTMITSFAQVQASLNTYNIVGHDSLSEAEKAMVVQQFQTLVDLEKGLHSLIVQRHHDMKGGNCRDQKGENNCTICNGATVAENVISNVIEKKNAMLTSYEGIITRFLDEIRRKDAVTHALKDTLAKSLLRGEKLERRIKALESSTRTSPSLTPK